MNLFLLETLSAADSLRYRFRTVIKLIWTCHFGCSHRKSVPLHEHFACRLSSPAFFTISMAHEKFAFPYRDFAAVLGFFV